MSNRSKDRKKKINRLKVAFASGVCILALLVALSAFFIFTMRYYRFGPFAPQPEPETELQTEPPATEPVTEKATEEIPVQTEPLFDPFSLQETDIYTFLQGPKAWESKADWSGAWHDVVFADQTFSVFGCGLCVLANLYGTLTPYDCSPLDALYFAEEVTDYHPVDGFGAIDWPYMQKTLAAMGITGRLMKKDKTYDQFQAAIGDAIGAVALISSAYDSTYWHDVPGHYVTLWLYDPQTDTVFLGDSGNPSHNRQRIPLRYIYDALKKSDRYQYAIITDTDPDGNTWLHDGIDITWNKPAYYTK